MIGAYISKYLGVVCALALIGGCRTSTLELKPVTSPQADQPIQVISGTQSDVEVSVILGPWDGERRVKRRVLPVRVRVINHSERVIRVSRGQFTLNSIEREHKSISPSLAARLSQGGRMYYSAGMGWGIPFGSWCWGRVRGPGCFWGYGPLWDVPVVVGSMPSVGHRGLDEVLPTGDLKPKGRVEGWVFFRRIPPQAEPIQLKAKIYSDMGEPMGVISVPLKLVREQGAANAL